MNICRLVILACWLVFLAYWIISSFGAKPSLTRPHTRSLQWGMRIAIISAMLLLQLFGPRQNLHGLLNTSLAAGVLGAIVCVLGTGLAIWARTVLGRNWGMPMTQRQNPELVTAGPYAWIRHPIYTGILVAVLGSSIAINRLGLLALALIAIYFIFSARREEKLMLELFPAQYPAYRARTGMLLPFIG